MADAGIKKVTIKNEDLPPVQFTAIYNNVLNREEVDMLHYDFRYRIVSEDRNRFSHWAPIVRFRMPDVATPFPYTADNRISISKGGNPEVVTAVWTKPGIEDNPSDYENIYNKTTSYDIWIRWNSNNNAIDGTSGWTNWEYISTVASNTFSILKTISSYKTINIAVQIPTTIKIRDYYNNKLTLFEKKGAV
jgi:hypothetical protein